MDATHFILVYSVPTFNPGARKHGKDYCESGIREIKYLAALSICSPNENVAVFKIFKKPLKVGRGLVACNSAQVRGAVCGDSSAG